MRSAFLLALGALALGYTVVAFRLDFVGPDGTLGPGFLPRLLGVAILGALLPELWRRPVEDAAHDAERHGRAALLIGALTVGFVALMQIAGTIPAAALYLLVCLRRLNPEAPRTNLALALGLPALLFLVFERWLNVGLPAGLLSALR